MSELDDAREQLQRVKDGLEKLQTASKALVEMTETWRGIYTEMVRVAGEIHPIAQRLSNSCATFVGEIFSLEGDHPLMDEAMDSLGKASEALDQLDGAVTNEELHHLDGTRIAAVSVMASGALQYLGAAEDAIDQIKF